jgi:hypothetical protein
LHIVHGTRLQSRLQENHHRHQRRAVVATSVQRHRHSGNHSTPPGDQQFVKYSVTYKRRKVGPELNIENKREPL